MKELLKIMWSEFVLVMFIPFYIGINRNEDESAFYIHEKPSYKLLLLKLIILPIYWAICMVAIKAVVMFVLFILSSF